MKMIITSTNQAKKEAIFNFFDSMKIQYVTEFIDVDSGVSTTPESDEEGIQGCINRINQAKKLRVADLYIGMEGIITRNTYGAFLCGWVCIQDKSGSNYLGCSAKCMLPPKISQNIHTFGELSQLIKDTYPTDLTHNINKIGTNGVITNSQYTRVDEFEDALRCAFGYLQNAKIIE